MEQIVSEMVGGILKKVMSGIMKQLRYVTSSDTFVTNMSNKMKELNSRSADVTKHMSRNKMYDKEIPEGVEGWLRDVETIRTKVESIPSDPIGCSHMITRCRAGRNAEKVIKKIQKLIDEKIEWTDAPLPKGGPTSSSRSTPKVEGGFKSRDVPFNEALKHLAGKSQVIALCGMGGVGKTTMMKKLKTVVDEKKMFGWFVEVTIGKEPNMHSIQDEIAECFGGEGLQNESKRAEGLRNMFKIKLEDEKKKILVILDDVWSPVIPLEDIGLTRPLQNGVTLLLTSRDAGICKTIAASAGSGFKEVSVNVLEEAEANNFFSKITAVSEKDDHDKYLIGCEIVKKCGYLPLAIHLIATAIKFQDVLQWRVQLSRLKHNDLDKNVQEIIKISYENVDVKDKNILLLCGLFPEDFNIPIEYLMRYAWGLKLWKYDSTLRDARDKTIASVNKLLNANLLMNSNYLGCVKLHDLVLSFVLSEISKSYPAWIINHVDVSKWDRDEMSESCKRISLTCTGMSTFPRNLEYSDLSLLQLMYGDELLKFPEEFCQNVHNVKVMAYYEYEMKCPLLPRSLKCSIQLRALCFHECPLFFDLSFLGDLVNLEELSFAGCGIRKLPSTIGNLRKLKLLDVSGCVNLRIDDGVFGNLKDLEELYMRAENATKMGIMFTDDNFEEFKRLSVQLHGLEVEFLVNKTQLKNVTFKKLDRFKISIGCRLEKEKDNEKYSFRNTLKLATGSCKDFLDCKIDELFKKTEKLHLNVEDMIHLKDVVSVHPYDEFLFRHLRDLTVSNCVKLEYLFTIPVAVGLRKLERLTISSCPILEAVVHNDRSEISNLDEMIKFEELKFLSLKKLPGLVMIPHLEKLKLKSMEKLKLIWARGSEEVVNSISTLDEIEVDECGSLGNLFPSNSVLLPRALKFVKIVKSGKEEILTTVAFPSNLMHSFHYLEELQLLSYNNVGVVFEIESSSSNRELVTTTNNSLLPNIQSITLQYMEKMSHVWKCNNWNKFLSLQKQESFLNLTTIQLYRCHRIRYLFSPLMAKLFSNLKEIKVNSCDGIEEVVSKRDDKDEDEGITSYTTTTLFRRLHVLSFWGLGNLKRFGGAGDDKKLLLSSESTSLCLERLPRWSYHNLIEIDMEWNLHNRNIIPTNELLRVQKLERIRLHYCPYVKEIFEVVPMEGTNNESQTVVEIPNLRHMELEDMRSLEYMWKSIFHVELEFPNLTTLSIAYCGRLKHVFTSVMVGSLARLQELHIINCRGMKSVIDDIDDEEEKSKCDLGIEQTVVLPCLKVLKLQRLSNLKGFYFRKAEFSWPSLDTLEIIKCPQITLFTNGNLDTPALDVIHTSFGRCYVGEDDINLFIKTKQQEGFEF